MRSMIILNTILGRVNFIPVCKSVFLGFFLPSAILVMFSVLCRLCLPKESQNEQIGVLHFVQYRAHVSVECFEHLGVDPRISNDTITCSLDSSERCRPSHSSHRCMWQTSQCLVGTGVSQRSHRMTSWRLICTWDPIVRFIISSLKGKEMI